MTTLRQRRLIVSHSVNNLYSYRLTSAGRAYLLMLARTLSWDWVGDARERYQIGDEPVVKVMSVTGTSPDNLTIEVSARDTTDNTTRQTLARCKSSRPSTPVPLPTSAKASPVREAEGTGRPASRPVPFYLLPHQL